MQPPKGKGIGVLIAVGKPKGGPPPLGDPDGRENMRGAMDQHESQESPEHEQQEESRMQIRPEDVDYSANDTCETCRHSQDGQCTRYGFPNESTGHCEAGYESADGHGAAEDQYGSEDQGTEGQYS